MKSRLLHAHAMLAMSIATVWFTTSNASAQPVPAAGQAAAQQAEHASEATTAPPATSAPPPTAAPQAPPSADAAPPGRAWELSPIDVVGAQRPALKEDERIGDYRQPRWAARRRFPTTRFYVMPKGEVEAEYWVRYTAPLHEGDINGNREIRTYYELGMGLGHRLQLDLYLVTQQDGHGPIELKREQVELRYALADYGEIWGNPTLYLEWQHRNGDRDWIEPKLLMGGEIAPRWHAAVNLVLERQLGGEEEAEWALTGGVSYTAVDDVLHAGVELYAEVHDFQGARWEFSNHEQLFLAGPSFMASPSPPFHVLLAPMFGVGKPAPDEKQRGMFRLWFVSSWAF